MPSAERPDRLVVVGGTGTEVGKTWVAARLLAAARDRGLAVTARKPAQSFAPGEGPTDAEVLAAATGEHPDEVCLPTRSYEVPMAPFMAAASLGRPGFAGADLLAEVRWPAGRALGVLEGAGGVRSPIAADGTDTVDLARALGPDRVVLVADAGLGTINAVRLAVAALAGFDVVVLLNRFDPDDDLHRANRSWLAEALDQPVLVDVGTLLDALVGPGTEDTPGGGRLPG